MRLEDNSTPDWADDQAMHAMRELHAPPGGESYWETLHARIMAHLAAAPPVEWWSFFSGWVRVGLAAAAVVGMIAGTAFVRSREIQARLAYEAAMDAASVVPVAGPWAQRGTAATSREATLRYVMSY
jgi:hypothetical protein